MSIFKSLFSPYQEGPLTRLFKNEYQSEYRWMQKNKIIIDDRMVHAYLKNQGKI